MAENLKKIHDFVEVLQDDPEPPLISYIQKKTKSSLRVTTILTACNCSRCSTCKFLNIAVKITDPKGSRFVIHHTSCITTGVVYFCQVNRRLADHPVEYFMDFSFPVVRHLLLDITIMTSLCALCYYGSNEVRKCREKELLYHLGTMEPNRVKAVMNVDNRYYIITHFKYLLVLYSTVSEALCLHS